MPEKIRIAMLGGGTGSMIGPVHRAAMRMSDQFDLVAGVFSSRYEESIKLGSLLGIPSENIYENYQGLVDDAKSLRLNAVSILTPNNLHVETAKAFVAQGINVICEKPLSASWDGVDELRTSIEENGVVFVLTHTYSGYPVIRKAREIVAEGKLGKVRSVSVEYLQGWLANLLESDPSNRGAVWREDPKRGGPGGALGDIGTHAFQLAEFVSGLKVESVQATVSSIAGRSVPDDAKMLLKLEGGATGLLWCSQVAVGLLNGIVLRIFGEKGTLVWSHQNHEELRFYDTENTETVYHKGQSGEGTLPPGHPEGYYEAFSVLYNDFADAILSGKKDLGPVPGITAGIRGLAFIDAVLESSKKNGEWIQV